MWFCPSCGRGLEDEFIACWSCGTARNGAVDPDFVPEGVPPGAAVSREINCLRCTRPLTFVGTRHFHEGARWGVLGEFGEFFVNKQSFDIFVCEACGHVEFFLSGIGDADAAGPED